MALLFVVFKVENVLNKPFFCILFVQCFRCNNVNLLHIILLRRDPK
jgi:hypothetical protein